MTNEPKLNPLSPWDELAKRVERLEREEVAHTQLAIETNKIVLDELKSIWKQMQHLHMCLAAVEIRLGIEPTQSEELKNELSSTRRESIKQYDDPDSDWIEPN